jgi:hypothetical protein
MKKTYKLAKFDAELNTDVCDAYNNAELTLKLRIGFKQVNPSGGAAAGTHNDYGDPTETSRKTIKWTAPEWERWKKQFSDSAQTFWNGKFWLINNSGAYPYKVGKETYIPNVWCRFELSAADADAASQHFVIDVVRLDPSEKWFGSHSTLYDNLDILPAQKGTDSKGKPIMQRAHVHEIGHLLGLGHVDEGKDCPTSGNTNAAACYGIADADKTAVMGGGMQIRIGNAAPWSNSMNLIQAMEWLTGLLGNLASPFPKPWTVAMTRHYPRTSAEAAAGKMLTSKPVRTT